MGADALLFPQATKPSKTEQQQHEQQEAGLTSPFAAVAQPYGDQRCGFATDSCDQDQQQPQLSIPSLQQAELLLQQLPAGGQDGGAADAQQLQEWRQRWNAVSPSVAGLEQLASAATMQYMDAQGGLGYWALRLC